MSFNYVSPDMKLILLGLCIAFLQAVSFAAESTPAAIPDPIMGDYVGQWISQGGKKEQVSGQVRSLGDGVYDGFVLLNNSGLQGTPLRLTSTSPASNGSLKLSGSTASVKSTELLPKADATLSIENGKLTGTLSGDLGSGQIQAERIVRKSPTLGSKPPAGAVMLFDGKDTSHWKDFTWKVTPEGTLQVGKGNIYIAEKYNHYRVHVEFRVPFMPKAQGQARGNSGVYLQSIYEVQVLDSFGLFPLEINDCGSVYGIATASGNACLPPMEWQTFDLVYRAGDPSTRGRPQITVLHNGSSVVTRALVPEKLVGKGGGGGNDKGGALMLQDHGNPV